MKMKEIAEKAMNLGVDTAGLKTDDLIHAIQKAAGSAECDGRS